MCLQIELLIIVIVNAHVGEFGDAPKADTQYLALFSNILHRMRFSKFLAIASEKLEKDKDVSSYTHIGKTLVENFQLRGNLDS